MQSNYRKQILRGRRLVVKVGSSAIVDAEHGLKTASIQSLSAQIAQLSGQGYQIALVSSGAVAEGRRRLGCRTEQLRDYHACAALGQSLVNQAWVQAFAAAGAKAAQILLTQADLSDRLRYLNARAALNSLLDFQVIPVLNENDAVATAEARFGNNDLVAAYASNLLEADLMVLLTDQRGLYSGDPRSDPDAQLIEQINSHDPRLQNIAGAEGSSLGTGGMHSKISAAQVAARSGTLVVISSSSEPDCLLKISAAQLSGSLLHSSQGKLAARKRWFASLPVKGEVHIDPGAVMALKANKSLLPIGVCAVQGDFVRGELIACCDQGGARVASGLSNYPADELRRIQRQRSEHIVSILGHHYGSEAIHRDNLAL